MKTPILLSITLGLLVGAMTLAPSTSLAQEKKPATGAEPKKPETKEPVAGAKRQGPIPFRGKVDAVDKTAKTVKVGERIFHVTSETRLEKNGKPATLDDAAVGDEVGGNYRTGDDGKLNASMMRFGPKPAVEKPAANPAEKGKKSDAAQP